MIRIANTDRSIDQLKMINQLNAAADVVQRLTAAGKTVVGVLPSIDGFGAVYQVLDDRGRINLLTEDDLQDDQN